MRGEQSATKRADVRVRAGSFMLPLDALLIAAAYFLVLILRFNGAVPNTVMDSFVHLLPIAIVVHIAANWRAGLYRRVWRHASLAEVRLVFVAGFGSGVVLFAASFATERPVLRSLIVLGAIVVSLFLGGVRLFRPVS
jgi:FlaA1/EpsC-like NDP-sugar epimerase